MDIIHYFFYLERRFGDSSLRNIMFLIKSRMYSVYNCDSYSNLFPGHLFINL
jgi:hypothetical protein